MAANPQKGEIEFTIGGKTYVFLLGTLGLARLEQSCGGRPWPKIFADANRDGWGWHMMLTCFHCGLALHHPEISERDASILLDELTVPEFMSAAWSTRARRKSPAPERRCSVSPRPTIMLRAVQNMVRRGLVA